MMHLPSQCRPGGAIPEQEGGRTSKSNKPSWFLLFCLCHSHYLYCMDSRERFFVCSKNLSSVDRGALVGRWARNASVARRNGRGALNRNAAWAF